MMCEYKTFTANRACALLYRYIKGRKGTFLLPANVCPVVPLTFISAGVKFQLVDINPETYCIDEEICLNLIKENTDIVGLCFVRTYGYMYDTKQFFTKLHQNTDFCIIDDRCLCLPEILQPHTFGADVVLYSTGYAKQVELGYGGFCFSQACLPEITNNFDGTDIEVIYKDSFKTKRPLKDIPTGWLEVSSLQETQEQYFGKIKDRVEEVIKHKEAINFIYQNELPASIQMPNDYHDWRFNIIVESNKKQQYILQTLFNNKLFASNHYQPVGLLFGCSQHNQHNNSQQLFDSVINLFNDHYFNEEMAMKTCKIIKEII